MSAAFSQDFVAVLDSEWRTSKLKYLIRALEAGTSVNVTDVAAADDQVGVLKTSCVSTAKFRESENKAVFEEEVDRVTCPVRAGEIIISRMNTPKLVGASALVQSNFPNLFLPDRLWQTLSSTTEMCRNEFLIHLVQLQDFRDRVSLQAEGASASMQSLSREDFLNLEVTFPPVREQLRIADFVERETARIDTLTDKQKKLIELLKEKRQAVISQAVTKGLDPDVTMRDSGVQWLGEVPAHWKACALRRVVLGVEQGSSPIAVGATPGAGEKGVLKISSIKSGIFDWTKSKTLESDDDYDARYEVRRGDLLLTRANTVSLVADAAVVGEVPGGIVLSDLVYRLKLSSEVSSEVTTQVGWPIAPAEGSNA